MLRSSAGTRAAKGRKHQLATTIPATSTGDRKQDAFGEQLPRNTRGAGAQCAANREFAMPRAAARQKQVGNIGASDQEHESDGAEQKQERGANVADFRTPATIEHVPCTLIGVGILFGDLAEKRRSSALPLERA